ncbi:MAG: hypothetical protein A2452_06580 [Candidatus Firestonebacteria bacterium RIFOXYC2_FULL_39_67]|nr:MAG: hypothetical protein A2452_06580 [Candidatus Firestonebacteria bacterium RIFOXYC2_FULL_39_67]
MPREITLILCDDHSLFREGIKKLLELEKDIKIIAETASGEELFGLLKTKRPDVILADIGLPGLDGISVAGKIKKLWPGIKILIMTIFEDKQHILEAIKAGAVGYLLKDVSIDELIDAIHKVNRGGVYFQSSIAPKILEEYLSLESGKKNTKYYKRAGLTEREREILRLIALGNTNKEISGILEISEKTVKNHINNIFQEINVKNRTQAAIFYLKEKT